MNKRISWVEYFMEMAINLIPKRSTCLKRNVGAVAVKNNRIIATGYNGQIPGAQHCKVCMREFSESGSNLDKCKALHAEQNLVCQAGERLNGSTVYVKTKPCNICFKLLAGSFVETIIYKEDYNDEIVDELISDARYYICKFEDNNKEYFMITKNNEKIFGTDILFVPHQFKNDTIWIKILE